MSSTWSTRFIGSSGQATDASSGSSRRTCGSLATPAVDVQTATAQRPEQQPAETQRHVAEARAAVVASMGNMLDAELQSRARMLHDNAAALLRQERDVARATDELRRERERLAREADAAAKKVKELGNVQNWAEVLERGFLVLEETVRLANEGGESADDSCSCSGCGSEHRGEDMGEDGEAKESERHGGAAVDADGTRSPWSEASRSLMETECSTGTGQAKGWETASLSTDELRDVDGKQPARLAATDD